MNLTVFEVLIFVVGISLGGVMLGVVIGEIAFRILYRGDKR